MFVKDNQATGQSYDQKLTMSSFLVNQNPLGRLSIELSK
jgi:hypothetical protein